MCACGSCCEIFLIVPHLSKSRFPTEYVVYRLSKASQPMSSQDPGLHLPITGIADMQHSAWLYTWLLRICTQVLMFSKLTRWIVSPFSPSLCCNQDSSHTFQCPHSLSQSYVFTHTECLTQKYLTSLPTSLDTPSLLPKELSLGKYSKPFMIYLQHNLIKALSVPQHVSPNCKTQQLYPLDAL